MSDPNTRDERMEARLVGGPYDGRTYLVAPWTREIHTPGTADTGACYRPDPDDPGAWRYTGEVRCYDE